MLACEIYTKAALSQHYVTALAVLIVLQGVQHVCILHVRRYKQKINIIKHFISAQKKVFGFHPTATTLEAV